MTSKQLARTDEAFRRDLGANPYGEPIFRWMKSDDQQLTYYSPRGTDWKANEIGLLLPVPIVERLPQVDGPPRWVLVHWFPAPPPEVWAETFRRMGASSPPPYPTHGWYYAHEEGHLQLEPHEEPTLSETERVIRIIRHHNTKTLQDFIDEGDEIVKRRNKRQKQELHDAVMDLALPFGNIPGKRGGPVSYGGIKGTELEKKEITVCQ